MLDDKAAASMTKADEEKDKVKARYAEERLIQGQPPTYLYDDAKNLAVKLIERETSALTQRLLAEEERLTTCPDAPLWVGVPMSLVPGHIVVLTPRQKPDPPQTNNPAKTANQPKDGKSTPLDAAQPALASDAVQIGPLRQFVCFCLWD